MSIILKLKDKYLRLQPTIKATIWFTLCSFIQKGISFITVPIFTRLLSTEEFGVFSIYTSWVTILSIIVTLNLSAGGFNNAMIKFKDDRDSFVSAMLGLLLCLLSVGFLVYQVFQKQIIEFIGLSDTMINLMFIEMGVTTIFGIWSQRLRFEYKYIAVVVTTVFVSILSPSLSVLSVCMIGRLAIYKIVANVVALVSVYILLIPIIIKKGKYLFSKLYWKYALGFNIPLIPHYLSQIVLNQADRIMISKLCGTAEAGIYSVAYNISLITNIFINSVFSSFTPWFYEKLANKDYKQIKKVSSILVVFFAGLSLVPIIIGPEVIAFMAPKEYYSAVGVIPPVSISVFFIFLYGMFANIEFFYEKKYFVAIGSIIAAILNILLNSIFIPRFGFVAAGYTTTMSYMIYSCGHWLFMKSILKQNKEYLEMFDMKLILLVILFLIIFSFLMLFLYGYTIIRYIILLIMCCVIFMNKKQIMNIFSGKLLK